MSHFHFQGAVPVGSPAYVERQFERSIRTEVVAGRWVLLLGPRQHGKSSGLIRLKRWLRDTGYLCAMVDFAALPPLHRYEELLAWFTRRVAGDLGITCDREPIGAGVSELNSWLHCMIPSGTIPVVLIIDEAAGISDQNWRESFYGQIRSMSGDRAEAEPEQIEGRLRFIFAGTFQQKTMVSPLNSPFQGVCTEIETEDLDLAQAKQLWLTVTGNANDSLVERIFSIVGGQPYLLELLMARVYESEADDDEVVLEEAISSLRAGEGRHFEGVFRRIFADERLSQVIARLAQAGRIPYEPANDDFSYLSVLGVAKREGMELKFRNALYEEFAKTSPQLLPSAATTSAVSVTSLIQPLVDTYSFVQDDQLAEIAYRAEVGAVKCYNNGNYRLALVGFGCALETILMYWLGGINQTDLANAVAAARRVGRIQFNNFESETDPSSWRLVNLVAVGRQAPTPIHAVDLPESLREWRNFVHPKVIKKNYLKEDDLEPEARAASGMLTAIRRDLSRFLPSP